MKEPKVPISLRVDPDLKTDIENEAFEAGLTTSKYLENILSQRHWEGSSEVDDVNEAWEELNNELEAENERLVNENGEFEEAVIRLARENRQFKADLEERLEQLEKLQSEHDLLREENRNVNGLRFNEEEGLIFNDLLDKLQTGNPGLTEQQLVLACLRTTLKNEKSYFFIHQLGANVL